MSVPGLKMLPPRKEYTTEYIKECILAFEDLATVKIKVKRGGSMRKKHSKVKTKTVYHTFNRSEYMRWWSSEFHAYRDAVGDGLAKGHVMRSLQLEAVLHDLEGKTNLAGDGTGQDGDAGETAGEEKKTDAGSQSRNEGNE